jgi:hypothetical protein
MDAAAAAAAAVSTLSALAVFVSTVHNGLAPRPPPPSYRHPACVSLTLTRFCPPMQVP